MLFSSITFIYSYFLLTVLLYFIAPKKLKNAVLLLFSLIFYAWGEPKYVILMVISIIVGYVAGLLMEKGKKKKPIFIASIVIEFAMLAYFKYADFFISNFNAVTGLGIPLLRIALPIGISFYTFQIVSYIADVYMGSEPANHSLVDLAAYISFFPQLIAGPIVRYGDIAQQLQNRTHSFDGAYKGIKRFVAGLSKKILIANIMGELVAAFKASKDLSIAYFWLYSVAFVLQIYFDFSGYSDMAIGLSGIFGFTFPENFNYPLISKSMTEFWRRWHISLGSWFKDYVYFPLGGSRTTKLKHYRNLLVVWMLTGFWHGADWTFIAWGLFYAFWLVVEKNFLLKYLEKNNVIAHIYAVFLTLIGFTIFDADGISGAIRNIGGLFAGYPLASAEFFFNLRSYALVMVIGIIFATPIPKTLYGKLKEKLNSPVFDIIEPVVVCLMIVICTAFLVDGSFNPFLYFRF